jgi:hypothetical protein
MLILTWVGIIFVIILHRAETRKPKGLNMTGLNMTGLNMTGQHRLRPSMTEEGET